MQGTEHRQRTENVPQLSILRISEFLFDSRKRFAEDSELDVSGTGRLGFQGLGAMVVVWKKEGEEEKVAEKNGVRKRRTDNVIKRAERLSPRISHGYFHIRQPSFHKETRWSCCDV